jgi:molybdenum cofactor synthesis domain-containing protein
VISLVEARGLVLERCPPLAPRSLPLVEAVGCVTSAPVVATEAVPPFANSAMDGYAVRAADTTGASEARPRRLRVVATVAAGAFTDHLVAGGEAVRIMTGAPMPPGADAVVMVERTTAVADGTEVDVADEVDPGTSVREAGDDVSVGEEVFAAATVLGPAHLGVLASLGRAEVEVVPRPRVGVLSTGDELVPPGQSLGSGQIRDSNRAMLVALVEASGFGAVDLGLVPDDEAAVTAALTDGAAACDALVTSGGVSMGDFDVVKVVLDRIAAMAWVQIAIKPAKPFATGVLAAPDGRAVPVLGLPGNPVSSLVSFELVARPGLRRMAGHSALDRPTVPAVAGAGLRRRVDGKTHYVRVRTRFDGDRFHAVPVASQGSHQLAATAGADGLAVLPDGDGVAAGETVTVVLLDPEAPFTAG